MDGMPVGPAELMKRLQHLYGLLQEPIYCSDELHMPSIIYEGRPEMLPWGSVNPGTPDINKSLTKARGVCLYCMWAREREKQT